MAQYKVIPGPMSIFGTGKKVIEDAANAYGALIMREAADGWRFVCFDSTTVHTNCCGCYSAGSTEVKLLVFTKDD